MTNVSDRSLLKNSLAQDFAANHTDLSGAVNKPVDLYINGEYRGSYLLSEKVQVGDGYIEIDDLEKGTVLSMERRKMSNITKLLRMASVM